MANKQMSEEEAKAKVEAAAGKLAKGLGAVENILQGSQVVGYGNKSIGVGDGRGRLEPDTAMNVPEKDHSAEPVKTIGGVKGALLGAALGLIFMVAGWLFFRFFVSIPDGWKTAEATVETFNTQQFGPDEQQRLFVRFTADDGRTHSGTISTGNSANTYVVGNTLTVAYDPANPTANIRSTTDKRQAVVAFVVMAFGGLLFVGGLFGAVTTARKK